MDSSSETKCHVRYMDQVTIKCLTWKLFITQALLEFLKWPQTDYMSSEPSSNLDVYLTLGARKHNALTIKQTVHAMQFMFHNI